MDKMSDSRLVYSTESGRIVETEKKHHRQKAMVLSVSGVKVRGERVKEFALLPAWV